MATLSWGDVAILGGVATVGFTLISWWYSAVMAKRNWTYQVKAAKKKPHGQQAMESPSPEKE